MKKARKKPDPELRVRISPLALRAVKMAAARRGVKVPSFVEAALWNYAPIQHERDNILG
jgi:predicted HicB family RNase H-like nuclease